ncbi:MAG: hypothetical protein AAFN30_13280, partial [Actinomycetota bacterium]
MSSRAPKSPVRSRSGHTERVNFTGGRRFPSKVAVTISPAAGHDALVAGLGDQPLVPTAAWRSVG